MSEETFASDAQPGPPAPDPSAANPGVLGWRGWAGWVLVLALAVSAYFHNLGSIYIPRHMDESPYMNITRLTAASGRLLPLCTDLPGKLHTKPPLLFWQGIAATGWGRNWDLWHLRWPCVLYTLATAILVGLLGWKLTRRQATAWVGLASYLAFFSSYRFGRPFLIHAPETFWLSLPFFILLHAQAPAFESAVLVPAAMGLALGIACLYKSFAVLIPGLLGLGGWYLLHRDFQLRAWLAKDALKLALVAGIALGMFGLWFLLDPNPGAIWKEFVLGENLGKFQSEGGYLQDLLWGPSSLWSLALGYPVLAGFLLFPVASLFRVAWRGRAGASRPERLLWLWLLAFILAFVPMSQRSGRYLLPAMPALALLLALHWQALWRGAFLLTLAVLLLPNLGFLYLSLRFLQLSPGASPFPASHWLLLGSSSLLPLAGLSGRWRARDLVLPAIFLTYLSFSSLLGPLEGPQGHFSQATRARVAGRELWLPEDFIGQELDYRIALPEARLRVYGAGPAATPDSLARQYPLFSVRMPLAQEPGDGCQQLGQRLVLKGRHEPGDLLAMLHGQLFEQLFIKEVLMAARPPAKLAGDGRIGPSGAGSP